MQKLQKGVFEEITKKIAEFEIDKKGTFKYIQIVCECMQTKQKMMFIRGIGGHVKFHKLIFRYFFDQFKAQQFQIVSINQQPKLKYLLSFTVKHNENNYLFTCIGGGRMVHDSTKGHLEIYGYSKTYAKPNKVKHDEARRLALKHLKYPSASIVITNKEY